MQHIYITEADATRLREMIAQGLPSLNAKDQPYLQSLEQELARATVVPAGEIPRNVITMHSKVRLRDLDSREEMTYTLVFPDEADPAEDKISVLAPVGTALIGCKVGDTVTWKVPAGVRRLSVKAIVFQPESSDDKS